MPVGVDDVLVAMAVAAAQAIGTEIAKSMLRSSTAHLATKEDVERAVDQIESFVHQEFLEAEARAVASDIDTVLMNLAQYEKSELRKDLLQSQQLLNAARARMESAKSANRFGEDYLRVQFVTVVRYIAASTAFWTNEVFTFRIRNETANLVDVLVDNKNLLTRAIAQIRKMEDEEISPPLYQENTWTERLGESLDGPPGWVVHNDAFARYTMVRGRYPNGVLRKDSRLHNAQSEAYLALLPGYTADKERIAKESDERMQLIYTPVGKTVAAIDAMIKKLGKSPKEAFENFSISSDT